MVVDIKVSTKPVLADRAEQQWGFGQIFPMLMPLGFVLYTVDSWQQSVSALPSTCIDRPADGKLSSP